MQNPEIISTDVIDGVWPFLQSIDWRDPWLALLLTFHVAVTMTALMTRNHANFQILLFLVLLLLVYFSESINEVAASNWMAFSRQQYFDSKGLFISIVFSVPILMNCMIMVASWLYQSSQLMTSLKRAQLRQQARSRQSGGGGGGGGDSSAANTPTTTLTSTQTSMNKLKPKEE